MPDIHQFRQKVWDFYLTNKRQFPWRNTSDPYKILVSELMLQQTQTSRVVEKYNAFIKAFPTFQALANASQSEVLKYWSGLGYNRRALYLKKIAENFELPPKSFTPEYLQTLPGIGPNTAGAIYVFSFNKPHVFIETNIRRVFIHEFFPHQTDIPDSLLLPLITRSLPKRDFRSWYYALMDYGAFLARTQVNPNRKSKHYTKQSTFEGSLRQTRGKILKLLLNGNLEIKKLQKEFVNKDHFNKALDQLIHEGFIVRKENILFLKS